MVSERNILYEHSSHPAVAYKMIKLFLVLDLGTVCRFCMCVCVHISLWETAPLVVIQFHLKGVIFISFLLMVNSSGIDI